MRWTTLSAAVAVLVASKAAGFGARGGRRVGGAFAPRLLSTTSLSMAVTSPTQVTPETQCAEAAKLFLTDANLKFSPTSGGVNNIVQYVEDSQGKKYILRVYNNGLNSVRVKWEHDILNKLKGKTQMSFRIPTMLPALATGETHVKLSTGAEACAMDLIPGALPKLTAVEDIGRASGELCTALADVVVDAAASPNPPYFELFKVHHAVTRDAFFDIMKGPEFDGCRAATTELVAAIVDMEAKIKSPQYMALPKQLIHGDLHYDNVLVENGKVTGLLDFEFCAHDWRAMELAVCLSKYAGEKEALQYFDTFTTGFAKHGILTEAEIEVIPELINLRVLSNVVYFVGRAIAKEDGLDALTTRAATYNTRVKWIRDNSATIVDCIKRKMVTK